MQREYCAQTRRHQLPPLPRFPPPGIAAKIVAADLHREVPPAIQDQCAEFSVKPAALYKRTRPYQRQNVVSDEEPYGECCSPVRESFRPDTAE